MAPNPLPDPAAGLLVELAEWQQVRPEQDVRLRGISFTHDASAQRIVEALRSRVDIREGYHGLEIGTTSYVGRVDVGPLRIAIRPKLPTMPLGVLLRYAYGLRDIETVHETEVPTNWYGFHDLLIALLVAEIEELVHRGLARRYITEVERLGSPRGRILVKEIARNGGVVEARLPCLHFDRRVNWHLNRVLRAGLDMAAGITDDRDLRRHVLRIAGSFAEFDRNTRLATDDILRAERDLTRLTASYAPALTVIRLLHEMLGVAFGLGEHESHVPGFLFDINIFFQRLLSRFLHDNLTDVVLDEWRIRNVFAFAPDANPKRRSAPTPRPDFALFRSKRLSGFLDAKYRDVWERGLPADWLYQLSIYALAAPNRTSVLLYATTSLDARDEEVHVRQPVKWSDDRPASVIIRPVPLQRLAELVHPDMARKRSDERRRMPQDLVYPLRHG
jgi:5-methylcytosine-specific restriction enzyme subunit McrC